MLSFILGHNIHMLFWSFLYPYSKAAECCHLAVLYCIVGPVLSCLFSLKLYITDNTV